MLLVLQFLVIGCGVIFITGSIATIAMIPFAVRNGLPSLKKEDVAGFIGSGREIPSVVRAVLLIRKIQTVAWWSALTMSVALIGVAFATS